MTLTKRRAEKAIRFIQEVFSKTDDGMLVATVMDEDDADEETLQAVRDARALVSNLRWNGGNSLTEKSALASNASADEIDIGNGEKL